MIPNQQNQKERKPETKSKMKKAYLVMPLIIVLMLVCVIPTIILISANVGHQSEIAEIDKDDIETGEEISAAVVTGGSSITIEEDGIYLIKLHGGSGATKVLNAGKDNEETIYGSNGSLTTGYIYLKRGDVLTTKVYNGGAAASNATYSTKGGQGISVSLGTARLGYVSGGPGSNNYRTRNWCSACASDEDTTGDMYPGTVDGFVEKVNTSSTATAGTVKTWYTISSTTAPCSKKDKDGTWSTQEYYQTGGRGR